MAVEVLDLADYVLIAAEALELDVEETFKITAIPVAEAALARPALAIGGVEFYGPLAVKSAVLFAALARHRPLVGRSDADQRVVAFLCMVEFIERNGAELALDDDLASQLVMTASGLQSDADFASWLAPRIGLGE